MTASDTRRVSLPPNLGKVHMVGIGGAGMSGLARILMARGGQVSGSDAKDSRALFDLRTRGAQVKVGHDPSALDLLDGGPDVVVTTHAAIPKDNPELVAAAEREIPVLLRPRVLARLMEGYRTLLVAGTHGKTSTTSMAVVALQHAGLDPSFAIGGELNESGTNAHHGNGDVFVAEADESDGSLLEYRPDVVVVTNIEVDHLDFFGSEDAYVQVFDDFANQIADGGTLIVCLDDPGARALAERTVTSLAARNVHILGYGTTAQAPDGVTAVAQLLDWQPRAGGASARIRFVGGAEEADPQLLLADGETESPISLTLPGIHMARNALGAILGCVFVGGDLAEVIEGVEAFGGVRRRFEFKGRSAFPRGTTVAGNDSVGVGVEVFDDYAHHPTEVSAVLTAAQAMAGQAVVPRRVIAVFQPHLYSRTRDFIDEFAAALNLADEVLVADVYGAREEPIPGVSGRSIVEALGRGYFVPDLSALAAQVADIAADGDIVLTLGAGDITMQGAEILAELDRRATL